MSLESEARQHPRVPVSLWAVQTYEGTTYFRLVRNLSLGGLFLDAQIPFEPGTEIGLELTLPTGVLLTDGRVTHVHDGEEAGNGVEFGPMPEEHRLILKYFLASQAHPVLP